MTGTTPEAHARWAVPIEARTEWLRLAEVLQDEGCPVPCETGDPEAWWPDRKNMDSPATRLAVQGCWRCPARVECFAYAMAAGEREGIWGALLPDERREMRQQAA